jgi:hypothetical protein
VPPIPTTTPRAGPPAPTTPEKPKVKPTAGLMSKAETAEFIKEHTVGKDLKTALGMVAAKFPKKRLPKVLGGPITQNRRRLGRVRKTKAKTYTGRFTYREHDIKISTGYGFDLEGAASTLSHELGHALTCPLLVNYVGPGRMYSVVSDEFRKKLGAIVKARYARLRAKIVAFVEAYPEGTALRAAAERKWRFAIKRLETISAPDYNFAWGAKERCGGLGFKGYQNLYDLPTEWRPDDFISPYSYATPLECVAEAVKVGVYDGKKGAVGAELAELVDGLVAGKW